MYGQIYEIKCLVNGKRYIGATTKTLEERFKNHCKHCFADKRKGLLYDDMRLYGPEQFSIRNLSYAEDRKSMFDTEKYFTVVYRHFYNDLMYNKANGQGSYEHSEEHKRKIREVNKGQKAWNKGIKNCYSDETINKMIKTRSKSILQYDLEGNFIREWESAKQAGEELGICKSGITRCCSGIYTKTGNFIFKYKQ